MIAIRYLKNKMEIKVAKWGKPKNILKNMNIIITIETNIPTKN
jgi:hypothetical protein